MCVCLCRTISSDPVEEENGDLKTSEDQEFRRAAEHEKLHLTWNIERRCFLDVSSVKEYVISHFSNDNLADEKILALRIELCATQ